MAQFYFLGNATHAQMLGCLIQGGGKTVVIDGGTPGDGRQLADILLEKANAHVDAWFFTHPHHDHVGAFSSMFEICPHLVIDRIYHCFPPIEALKTHGIRHEWEIDLWQKVRAIFTERFCGKVRVLRENDRFSFGAFSITVLRVYNEEILANFVNNSSAVYRIESASSSVLILGDLGAEGGDDVMRRCRPEALLADYTQMAHHGQRGVRREFYEYIRPRRCLWASPAWLWNNDAGKGFDTGPWETVRTREWVAALGVTEHFVQKDGTQLIEL